MYCTNCGESLYEHAEICPKCGVRAHRVNNYCHNCGVQVNERQEMCVSCGASLKKLASNDKAMEPWLAALLSFLIVGLGQMLIGQVKKGVVFLIGSVVLAFVTFGLSVFITSVLAIVDAYLIAKKKKEGKEVGEWEFF